MTYQHLSTTTTSSLTPLSQAFDVLHTDRLEEFDSRGSLQWKVKLD